VRALAATAAAALLLARGEGAAAVAAPGEGTRLAFAATIAPVAAIVREVAGRRAEVRTLLPPGVSPHTYEPKPSDLRAASAARAVFYAQDALDGWAVDLPQLARIELFSFVPPQLRLAMPEGHAHGHRHASGVHSHAEGTEAGAGADGHFWTSPLTVRAVLPELAETLSRLDPAGAAEYRTNARRFDAELRALHRELSALLQPYAGEHLLLLHPSLQYFLRDYGLELAAAVEPAPGKEPSPRYVVELVKLVRRLKVKAVFAEPQLPPRIVRVLAEETGLPVYELDPLGGIPGRRTYSELLRYNAHTVARALGPRG